MEITRAALLVTPSTHPHPIRRLIEELKEYGVDARSLDMSSPAAGWNHILDGKCTEAAVSDKGPVLLVSTLTNTEALTFQTFPTPSSRGYQRVGSTHTPTSQGGRVGSERPGRLLQLSRRLKRKSITEWAEERGEDDEGNPERDGDYSTES